MIIYSDICFLRSRDTRAPPVASRRALYTIVFDLQHVERDEIDERVQFWVDCVQSRCVMSPLPVPAEAFTKRCCCHRYRCAVALVSNAVWHSCALTLVDAVAPLEDTAKVCPCSYALILCSSYESSFRQVVLLSSMPWKPPFSVLQR